MNDCYATERKDYKLLQKIIKSVIMWYKNMHNTSSTIISVTLYSIRCPPPSFSLIDGLVVDKVLHVIAIRCIDG